MQNMIWPGLSGFSICTIDTILPVQCGRESHCTIVLPIQYVGKQHALIALPRLMSRRGKEACAVRAAHLPSFMQCSQRHVLGDAAVPRDMFTQFRDTRVKVPTAVQQKKKVTHQPHNKISGTGIFLTLVIISRPTLARLR